VILSCKK